MHNDPKYSHNAQSHAHETDQSQPPVSRWKLPAPRLQGVRFIGPVARIATVDSPVRPKKSP